MLLGVLKLTLSRDPKTHKSGLETLQIFPTLEIQMSI